MSSCIGGDDFFPTHSASKFRHLVELGANLASEDQGMRVGQESILNSSALPVPVVLGSPDT